MAREPERRGRKTRHRVEREAHHLAQGVIGLPRMALGAVVRERHLAEADPRHHPADEARLFGQRQQGIERAAAHQPEITGIERSEEHTSELQSLMRISYAVFCLKKKTKNSQHTKA